MDLLLASVVFVTPIPLVAGATPPSPKLDVPDNIRIILSTHKTLTLTQRNFTNFNIVIET